MAWQSVRIGSWQHFSRLVQGYPILGTPFLPSYLFRGQSKSDWPLIPSLLRFLGEVSPRDALRAEQLLLEEFQSRSQLYWEREPGDKTDLAEWWSLMQHHGVPTRLLDWTASPYVAAYFAVDAEWDDDGAIYIMHPSTLSRFVVEASEGDNRSFHDVVIDENAPLWINPLSAARLSDRMAAQQGHFTLCANICGNHGDIVAEVCNPTTDEQNAIRLVIPSGLKPEFLMQLRAMNVTGSSLFPGADGLGRSLREATRLHAYAEREHAALMKGVADAAAKLND